MVKLKYDKYAVTGAAGFIGSHIAEEIIKQGKKVVCIDNLIAGRFKNLPDGAELLRYDVLDLDKLVEAFKGVDVVFHEAASKCTVCRKNPHRDLLVNAMGTFNVFEAARICGVKKVIHASTGSVKNGKPVSFYGVSKLAGENYLRAVKEYHPEFNFTAIRYYHVFGPRQECGDDGGVVAIFAKKIANELPINIYGDGFQQRHFTYVKDVVAFNFMAESSYDNQFVSYAEPSATTINELAVAMYNIAGKDVDAKYKPKRPGDIYVFDIDHNVCPYDSDYRKRFLINLKTTMEYYG